MLILNARSPYFITVNEAAQVGSQIEIFLWHIGDSVPGTATYTLSKSIASASQLENRYNISTFVKSYIENIAPDEVTDDMSVNVRIKRYKEVSLNTYTLLDTTDYVAVNGYNSYLDGYNKATNLDSFYTLADSGKKILYSRALDFPYLNVYGDLDSSVKRIDASYKDLSGGNETVVSYTAPSPYLPYMLKVPVSLADSDYDGGNTLDLKYYDDTTLEKTESFIVNAVCEPKYSPVVCSFINRFGGWQFLTFFKAKTESIVTEKSTFNLLPDALDYDVRRGQKKDFNLNGQQSIKLNTGWVPENYSDLIQDLLLSETVLLDGKPVNVKTQGANLKTSIQDRNINYEVEFQYSYNLINNVV